MAKKKEETYESKAITTSIKVSSRASIKVADNYYTIEYTEERSIPEDANVEVERSILWEVANSEVDNQIQDILQVYGRKK